MPVQNAQQSAVANTQVESAATHFNLKNAAQYALEDGVYPKILSDKFSQLAPAVQQLHRVTSTHDYVGQASIVRGEHVLVPLVAAMFRFPPASRALPVQLQFRAVVDAKRGNIELWRRQFGQSNMPSEQYVGTGRQQHLLMERIGMAVFAMQIEVKQQQLHLHIQRWWFCGVVMPLWLKPRIRAFEFEDDLTRFNFFVEIALPVIGLIVRYQGWLLPKTTEHVDQSSA